MELREEPNPEAKYPSGMCGERQVCFSCPSAFLCHRKAAAERDIIEKRKGQQ